MEIIRVKSQTAGKFIEYCIDHRDGLDDTFLIDEELEKFKPESDPSFIAVEDGSIVGAVSLKMDEYLLRGKKARFRILYSRQDSAEVYDRLFSAIKPEMEKVEKVFVFVPEKAGHLRNHLARLGFRVERYSYLLVRKAKPIADWSFGPGFSLREYIPGNDEADYCRIRNTAFARLAGSEIPMTEKEAAELALREDYLPGGTQFLCHFDKPVGLVRVAREFYNDNHYALIGPIALVPDYQKKGLGRQLLRAGLAAGMKNGLEQAILSVNAENEQAVQLYFSEDFETEESFMAYEYIV